MTRELSPLLVAFFAGIRAGESRRAHGKGLFATIFSVRQF
jgi:hypothetical protein